MLSVIAVVATTAAWAVLLMAAGTLVSYGVDSLPRTLLWALRLALGMSVVPITLIVGHELLGARVHITSAIVLGLVGVCLVVVEARSRRARAKPARAGLGQTSGRTGVPDNATAALLLLLCVGVFFTCLRGAALYPGFEGRDPWGHALGVAYVGETGSLRQPDPEQPILDYVDAYPPLYDVLMSLPCGTAGSIELGLKAMNALIVALVNLLLFLLARQLTKDDLRASVATLFYVVMPGNLTRHPWGHSLAVALLLAGLVCALEVRHDRRWILPGATCFAAVLLAAPSQGLKAGVILILTALAAFGVARVWAFRLVVMGSAALVVAGCWFAPAAARHGFDVAQLVRAMQPASIRTLDLEQVRRDLRERGIDDHLPPPYDAASDHRYTIDDFLFFRPLSVALGLAASKRVESIAPTGLGVPVIACALVFLFACSRQRTNGRWWRVLLVIWLGFTTVGVLGSWIGLSFFTWRFWMLLAPFACLAAADGLVLAAEGRGGWTGSRAVTAMLLACCAAHLTLTLWFDLTQARIWRHALINHPFLVVIAAYSLLAWGIVSHRGENAHGPQRRWVTVVLLVLGCHLFIAAPMRLKALSDVVPVKGFYDPLEEAGYLRVQRLTEPGAKVLPLSGDRCRFVIGLDRSCRSWAGDERELARRLIGRGSTASAEQVLQWMAANHYSWVILDPTLQARLAERPGAFDSLADRLASMQGTEVVLDLSDSTRSPASRFLLIHLQR